MKEVSIREFSHHISAHLKLVKAGERLVLLERSVPIADILPHNPNLAIPRWKTPIRRVKIKGKPLSESLIEDRRASR
ncbi:MAG: hypothetical protein AAB066_04920 [Candidatus Margulisiibacteriota bacterium]|jgi:antitoxin (DNA-binding transcriptional repressor) of toxin-antitoxin stability system